MLAFFVGGSGCCKVLVYVIYTLEALVQTEIYQQQNINVPLSGDLITLLLPPLSCLSLF